MRKLVFAIAMFVSTQSIAQSYDSSFRFYYYDQKLSMFEEMPDQKGEVVWLGDSITDGGEWSELFPKAVTLNRGISADNTFGILNRINEITKRKPQKVFILIGINDLARKIPDSVILANYTKIIDSITLQSPATKIYVQSILPTNNNFTDFKNHQNKDANIANINKSLEALSQAKKAIYVNLHKHFTDSEGKLNKLFTNDGLHLTGKGYQKWKSILLQNKFM